MGVRKSKHFVLRYFDPCSDNYWHLWIPNWFVQLQPMSYDNCWTAYSILGRGHCHIPCKNHRFPQSQYSRVLDRNCIAGRDRYAVLHWTTVTYLINTCTGLFTVTSIGLAPSRILDTYSQSSITTSPKPWHHPIGIFKIWIYKQRTRTLRKKAGLPTLFDEDDLPDPFYDPNYVHVLTEAEQKDLHRRELHRHLSGSGQSHSF